MKSALRKRLLLLLGIAEKRENSFIQAVNEMSFAIHFHGLHVADPQHPRVAPAHGVWGGCVLFWGRHFWKGRKCTKALKHNCCAPRAWGLCLPWLLLPGEVAQCPLPAQGTQWGSAETWQSNTPFLWGLAPETLLGFIFPLILLHIYLPCFACGQLEESPCLSSPHKA